MIRKSRDYIYGKCQYKVLSIRKLFESDVDYNDKYQDNTMAACVCCYQQTNIPVGPGETLLYKSSSSDHIINYEQVWLQLSLS